jgi:hypothetical protein
MATSSLSFLVVALNPPEQVVLAAVPVIDGRPLTDLVTKFETKCGYDPAGGYGGVVFEFVNIGLSDNYFGKSEETFVLGCECGELGCWPLKCSVRDDRDTITWANFSQPHRPDRDYSSFGPFLFERAQYAQAVSSLTAQLENSNS